MKQPLNEEFRRMQKLAGLINESQIKTTLNEEYIDNPHEWAGGKKPIPADIKSKLLSFSNKVDKINTVNETQISESKYFFYDDEEGADLFWNQIEIKNYLISLSKDKENVNRFISDIKNGLESLDVYKFENIPNEEIEKAILQKFNSYSETKLFADFSLESESDNSLESRFARSISEVAREYDYIDNIDIPGYFDVYEDGDNFYAGPTESSKFFQTLPDKFVVTNNMNDVDESFEITKTGPDSFIAKEIK